MGTQPQPKFYSFTYDTGYAIMDNGDIVTSDGLPRSVDEADLMVAQAAAGRKLEFRFRAPRPDEEDDLRAQGILIPVTKVSPK